MKRLILISLIGLTIGCRRYYIKGDQLQQKQKDLVECQHQFQVSNSNPIYDCMILRGYVLAD